MANREKETSFNPLITIVVGTLNRPHVVLRLIDQLKVIAPSIQIEVLIIDQSSPDNFLLIQGQFPKLSNFSLVHFDKPNTCRYLNFGWENAQAPIVLYLDDDVSLTPATISSHIKAYRDKGVLAVAGRVINDGENVTPIDTVGKINWYGAEFIKNFNYSKNAYVDFPYGCNMSYQKKILEKVGGFDERFSSPTYSFNEVDLGYRLSSKWKNSILFVADALVFHHQYGMGGTRNDFEKEELMRGNCFNYGYFLGKNFTWWQTMLCFLRRFPYQIVNEPFNIPYIIKGFISSRSTTAESRRRKEA